MSNTTNNTVSAASTTPVVEAGAVITNKVQSVQPYGVLVRLTDAERGPCGLMRKDQLLGGSNPARTARLANLKQGDEVTVTVVSVRPPKEGDTKGQIRYDLSERALQESSVKEQLAPETKVGCKVHSVNTEKGFALVSLTEGVGTGYLALLHASEMPGADRDSRDSFCANLQVGQELAVEVKSVNEAQEKGRDLQIKVSMTAGTRRAEAQARAEAKQQVENAVGDAEKVWKGNAIKSVPGGMIVGFGPMDAGLEGFLPSAEVPAALRVKGSVKVKVASQDGGRILLTRKGVK